MPLFVGGDPGMSRAQTRELVTQIAEALGEGWTVAEDRHHRAGSWELCAPGGIELCVQVGPVQVAVRGIHEGIGRPMPCDYGCTQPVIRFSAAKTPQRMAGEITRRLLPAVEDDAAILTSARADRDAQLAGRLAILRRARELLNGDLTWDQTDRAGWPAELDKAANTNRYGKTPHVVIDLRDHMPNDHLVEVHITDLDHEQVLVIVDAVAGLITAGRPT